MDGLAAEFLTDLYPRMPGGLSLVVWTNPGRRSAWCDTPAEGARAAGEQAGSKNVYVGASLQDRRAAMAEAAAREREAAEREGRPPQPIDPEYVRGFSETAGGIGAFWCEVDVKGPGHKEQNLPPTIGDALNVLANTFPTPTWLVRTGGGVQGWWLLDDVWVFESATERDRAARLLGGWVDTLGDAIRAKGWVPDTAVRDLARVLRVPGTFNRKPEMVEPVLVTAERIDQRYGVAELEKLIRWPAPRLVSAGKGFTPRPWVGGQTLSDQEKAEVALSKLGSFRVDEYRAWVGVGQALHAVDASAAMCAVWDAWSRRSAKHEDGACARKWGTFGTRGGKSLKLGSLIRWAQEDTGVRDIFTPPEVKTRRAERKTAVAPKVPAGDGDEAGPPADDAEEGAFILDPAAPLVTARRFCEDTYRHVGRPTLLYAGGTFYFWNGSAYEEVEPAALRKQVYDYTEPAKRWVKQGDGLVLEDFKPTPNKVSQVIDALASHAYAKAAAPCWLCDDATLPPPVEIMSAKNGLLHLNAKDGNPLRPPTPARILSAVIGLANVCGPTLSSLATNFGLWPLVNKQLAVISDARLSGRRADEAVITERLLAISGEDAITIDRKNLQPVTLRLTARFMFLSNELPMLADGDRSSRDGNGPSSDGRALRLDGEVPRLDGRGSSPDLNDRGLDGTLPSSDVGR